MAAPAQVNTLRDSDFPKGIASKADTQKLFQILNPFLTQAGAVTKAGTSLGQNIDGQAASLAITTPADWKTMTLTAPFVALGGGWPAPAYRSVGRKVELRGLFAAASAPTINQALWSFPSAAYNPTDAAAATGRLFAVPISFNGGNFMAMGRLDAVLGMLTYGASPFTLNSYFGVTPGAAAITSVTFGALDAVSWDIAKPIPFSCFPALIRLKDGKKPQFVLAKATPAGSSATPALYLPAWTALGTGATGNQLRIDDIPGLLPATSYQVDFFIFF